jgi:hypothetical protein
MAATAGAEVSELSTESNGGARSRTADLGIMSRSGGRRRGDSGRLGRAKTGLCPHPRTYRLRPTAPTFPHSSRTRPFLLAAF